MFTPGTAARTHSLLREAVENKGVLPEGLDTALFTKDLLENFASPDPVLRDELSYSLMAQIFIHGRVPLDAQESLLKTALDDQHLFYRIGETECDSVFMRAFSVLMVPLALEDSPQAKELGPETVSYATRAVLRYASDERDRRGYVEGKGWAHSVAHTADALAACGLHPYTTEADCIEILNAIMHLSMQPVALGHLEDDRLAFAAFSLIQSGNVQDDNVRVWLDRFQLPTRGNDSEQTLSGANAEHMLRSLYFRFLFKDEHHRWLGPILQAVSRFDIYQLYGEEG